MYYCQKDGGQWNVRVNIIHTITAQSVVIAGKDLIGHADPGGLSYLVVHPDTLHETEQF